MASGRVASLAEIARREGVQKRYATRLTKLAFVAPAIAEAVAAGRTPLGVNLQVLMDGRLELAPSWFEQERMLSGADARRLVASSVRPNLSGADLLERNPAQRPF